MYSGTFSRAYGARLATLLGTSSFLTMGYAIDAHAQGEVAQADEIPETVLITGSLIRGTTAVGVPVTNLSPMDFAMTGALTTADLFRTFPAANVAPGSGRDHVGREHRTRHQGEPARPRHRQRHPVADDDRRHAVPGPRQRPVHGRPLDHPGPLDGPYRRAGGRRVGHLRLGRGRRRDQHHPEAQHGRRHHPGALDHGRRRQEPLSRVGRLGPDLGRRPDHDLITSGTTKARCRGISIPSSASTTRPGASTTAHRSAPRFRQRSRPAPHAVRADPILPVPAATMSVRRPSTGNGCINCYAVPLGTGWNFGDQAPGPTLNWADFTSNGGNRGTNGLRNQFDPFDIAWYDARQERNGGHITVDQRLTSNISFYGSGFYSNRRGHYLNPSNLSPSTTNIIGGTTHPDVQPLLSDRRTDRRQHAARPLQYRLGKPEHHLVLRTRPALSIGPQHRASRRLERPRLVLADAGRQLQHRQGHHEQERGLRGLGLDHRRRPCRPAPRRAIATWTKPGSVPYLNLVCDPLAYTCNSPETLAYIQGIRSFNERYWINEKGVQFDGPLFDLPGGTVKAAVGATYTSLRLQTTVLDNTGASSLIVPYQQDAQGRQIWAAFTQVNIPRVQRAERVAVPAPCRPGILLASRPVQRREGHQQSEGGVQLGADRLLHHPRHVGHLVPRSGVRRNLAAGQRRHRRPEPRQLRPATGRHHGGLRKRSAAGRLGRLEADELVWPRRRRYAGQRERRVPTGAFVMPNGHRHCQHPADRRHLA